MIRFIVGLLLVLGAVGNIDTNADVAWYITLVVMTFGFALLFWVVRVPKVRFN